MKWARPNVCCGWIPALALLGLFPVLLNGCAHRPSVIRPSIEFSIIPQAEEGGPDKRAPIAGRVIGARSGQHIVLFAKSGMWWVQPTADEPFTTIKPDSTWTNSTHLGTEYAAVLVEPGYRPPPTFDVLPNEGGAVAAVKTVRGNGGNKRARELSSSVDMNGRFEMSLVIGAAGIIITIRLTHGLMPTASYIYESRIMPASGPVRRSSSYEVWVTGHTVLWCVTFHSLSQRQS